MDDQKIRSLVLVVEDNIPVATVLCLMLKQIGYSTQHFVDGQNAIEGISEMSETLVGEIGLIISDIMMPVMDGLEFRAWTLNHPHLNSKPFIFYSALTEPKVVSAAIALSTHGYLVKPVSLEKLKQRMALIFQN